jgi:predicted transcriptional regulator of viral defense system
VASRLALSASRASHLLQALEDAGLARRLRHGLWLLATDIAPFRVVPYLTAPFPAYVSLWSALAEHGMIDQIPAQVFVVSPHRTQQINTTIGTYSIHRLAPELFDGYRGSDATGYVATPEKALFDTVYVRAPRGGQLFLPELSLPERFDRRELDDWISRIARPRLRTLVSRGLQDALQGSASAPAAP